VTYLEPMTEHRNIANTPFRTSHINLNTPFAKVDEIGVPVCRTNKVIFDKYLTSVQKTIQVIILNSYPRGLVLTFIW